MRKITSLLMLLCAFVGTAWAQEIRGVKEVPTTAVDFSAESLTTGYYLIKQTNTAETTGYLKAASEAANAVVTPTATAPTANAENEATYIWYVEVDSEGKFSIATANKIAAWQAPTQRQKNLVSYDSKATTLELETDFASLNGTTQTLVKAYWEDQACYSYVHASSHNLGSWNDQNTASLFYLEFYPIAESNLVIIDEMAIKKEPLVQLIAEKSELLGKIALQTTDANAPYYLSATQQGDAPISKAIDGEASTYYGSTWGATVGHHHYWQVDLVDAANLAEFTFSYITRANGTDTPTQINVQGSTDGETFTDIVVLTKDGDGLPTTGGSSYTSTAITNNGYRYIRFEVPSTTDNYSAAGDATQEVTIGIAEFSMKNTDESSYDAELVAAIAAAQAVVDNPDATEEDINNAINTLAWFGVEKPTYPFTITTDDENPVVYAIKSGRGDAYWYTYDATDGKIALSAYTADETQLWYFKEVQAENYTYVLQLIPYADKTKAMSYTSTTNAVGSVSAQAIGTDGYTNYWYLVATDGAAPYGLQTYDKANYLSNNGGVGNKMGMWTAAPNNDEGTAMYFLDPAQPLTDLIAEAKTLTAGTTVGSYSEAGITSLQTAIATAEAALAAKNYSTAELQAAIDALEINMPDPAKFYVIKSATSDGRANKKIYVNDNGGMQFEDATTMAHVFQFVDAGDNTFYLKSVERGTYLSTNMGHGYGQQQALATETAEAKAVAIANMGRDNVVSLTPVGGAMIHAQTDGSVVVAWNKTDNTGASAWVIEEIDAATVSRAVTISDEAGWASLILGYNATIPAGVKAYAVTAIGTGHATLSEVTDAIPAGEAVLLEGAGTHEFTLTETATAVEGNKLEGTVFNTNIDKAAWILGLNEGVVGLYTVTLDQAEGTAFTNNAFKAYLPKTSTEGVLRLEIGTTGIENAIVGENGNAVIFDLSGRRVAKMQKGIYIVNGKKVLVK